MKDIIKKLKVGDRISFYSKNDIDTKEKKIYATVKCLGNLEFDGYPCNDYICVERNDNRTGGGCTGKWILNKNGSNWKDLDFIYIDNPNSNIKIRKKC